MATATLRIESGSGSYGSFKSLVAVLMVVAFCCAVPARGQTLEWIRQLGSTEDDSSNGVSADGLGSVYITGKTRGNLGGANSGDGEAFLSKYHADGSFQWTRQLGNREGAARGISADGLGSVYITGDTGDPGETDVYLIKFDAAGTLQWTQQLGSTGGDSGWGVSADGLESVYITGETDDNLAGPNAGRGDAFIAKYDASGTLEWSRQLGTSEREGASDISADGLGSVYITGWTRGSLGGPHAGSADAFLSKYDDSGTLQWSRQLGTSEGEGGSDISADGLGSVYITGGTEGSLGGPHAGSADAYLSKFDAAGTLQWSRQLGTSEHDAAYGVSADGLGSVYISGTTSGSLEGTNAGYGDAFLSKYDANGTLQWTQQIGTRFTDSSNDASADGLGNVYITGDTNDDLGGPNAGGLYTYDVFLAKFSVAEPTLDFNQDSQVDVLDVDALVGEIVAGTHSELYDLNDDGIVNKSDLTEWCSAAAMHNGFGAPYLPGDSDLSGTVDAADLNALAVNWRKSEEVARWSAGNFEPDDMINAADLNALAINWRKVIPTASTAGAPVPEPSALLLTVLGLALIGRRIRCK